MATTIILAVVLLILLGVYVKEERSLKKDPCNPLDCKSYASGYCEYDFATGMVMPMDDQCPLLREGASEVIGNDPEN